MEDAEQGGVCADAERERRHDDQSKGRTLASDRAANFTFWKIVSIVSLRSSARRRGVV